MNIIFLAIIFLALESCSTSSLIMTQALNNPKDLETFEPSVTVSIPVNNYEIQAEINRPEKKQEPKTLIILVPGSGNISRFGESTGDGIDLYKKPLDIYALWAKALSNQGFFVLSYDKRTCTPASHKSCKLLYTKDIDDIGIKALVEDLDQIYNYVETKLSYDAPAHIFLMTTTQGTQVVSLSKSAQKARGIILLSPIAGDLESLWVTGLMQAHKQKTNISAQTALLNQAESTKAFFANLKKTPDNTRIHGASVIFWRSWVESSKETVNNLALLNKHLLVLLSAQDVFSTKDIFLNNNNYIKNKRNFNIKITDKTDRNFISNNNLASGAIDEVVNFIKKTNK